LNIEQFYFLCKVKQFIFSLSFGLSFIFSNLVKGQDIQTASDSIIYNQLLSIENGSILPLRKQTFVYSIDQKVKEKNTFRWERNKNQWIPEYKYRYIYHTGELLIEKFAIENQKNEILIARNIALLDTNGSILKVELFNVDRYSGKSERQNAQEFEYKGDTLISYQLFEQGTTFFKKKEVKYLYQKQKWTFLEKTFHEVKGDVTEKKYEYLISNGLPAELLLRNANGEIIQKDSFEYNNKLLVRWHIAAFESSGKSKQAAHTLKSYVYDEANQLKSCSTIHRNHQKKEVNHSANAIINYYSNKKTLIKPTVILKVDPAEF
jgi:hypothetical protein